MVGLGWVTAALLFLLSLRAATGAAPRAGAHMAMAGAVAATTVTLYSHDVVNLPPICGALIMGGAIGLFMARALPMAALPSLLAGLIGLGALAVLMVDLAAWRNPYAFGLLDDTTGQLSRASAVALALGVPLGAMASAGAVTMLWKGAAGGGGLWAVLLSLLTLTLAMLFALHPTFVLLCTCAGAALSAGHYIAHWGGKAGTGPVLAMLGGLTGCSGAAAAFLLANPAMVVAGGLAGAAGSMFALRLCGGTGRKGLADRDRQP